MIKLTPSVSHIGAGLGEPDGKEIQAFNHISIEEKNTLSFKNCPNLLVVVWGGGPVQIELTPFRNEKFAQIASRGGGEILGIDKKKDCFFWDYSPSLGLTIFCVSMYFFIRS